MAGICTPKLPNFSEKPCWNSTNVQTSSSAITRFWIPHLMESGLRTAPTSRWRQRSFLIAELRRCRSLLYSGRVPRDKALLRLVALAEPLSNRLSPVRSPGKSDAYQNNLRGGLVGRILDGISPEHSLCRKATPDLRNFIFVSVTVSSSTQASGFSVRLARRLESDGQQDDFQAAIHERTLWSVRLLLSLQIGTAA